MESVAIPILYRRRLRLKVTHGGHHGAPAPGSSPLPGRGLPGDIVPVPLISLGVTPSASTGPMPPLPLATGDRAALCTREHEEQGPSE